LSEQFNNIVDYFKGKLIQIPPVAFDDFYIPANSRWFLENIGLPMSIEFLYLDFCNHDVSDKLIINNRHFMILGDEDEYGAKICIEQSTGKMYSVETKDNRVNRFINTDVICFMQCMTSYMRIIPNIISKEYDLDAIAVVVNEIKCEILAVDEKALEDGENWWSVLLEQHEWGLM